jgi:hypothetical protein
MKTTFSSSTFPLSSSILQTKSKYQPTKQMLAMTFSGLTEPFSLAQVFPRVPVG